jgi:hypothetical protein
MRPLPCDIYLDPNQSISRIEKEVEKTANTHLILLMESSREIFIKVATHTGG